MMLCNSTLTDSSSDLLSDMLSNTSMLMFMFWSSKQERACYAEVLFARSTHYGGSDISWDIQGLS